MKRLGTVLTFVLTLSGCVTTHKTPSDEIGAKCGAPDECWAGILQKHVNAKGQVNFEGVRRDADELAVYVRFIASESPLSHPDRYRDGEKALAYYLNSYNALAMWGVIQNDIPTDFDSFFKRLSFFKFNEYEIGGRYYSLYDYENDYIRKLGDPRVHFALNCMSVGCPRLPREPFPAKNLNATLDSASREFFNSPLYLRVDHAQRTVYISEILDFFTEDFVGPGKSKDLIEYVNKYSATSVPGDYSVAFIPYDWTVNKQ